MLRQFFTLVLGKTHQIALRIVIMAGADVKEFTVFGLKMWQQVLIGLMLGILTGFILKEDAAPLKTVGTIFIDLIKMVVVPLIFLALVSGITSMGDGANFKRVGLKGLGSYLATATFAVVIGITAGILFQPGKGLHVNIEEFAGNLPAAATDAPPPSVIEFLLHLIPTNVFEAFAEGHLLQVIVFSVMFGIVMNMMGEKAARPREIIHDFAAIIFRMIEYIVRLAPLAVFGFMAWSVGTQGVEIIRILINLVIAVLAACAFQYALFGVLIVVFTRLNPLHFYRKLATTQLMAFSTSSSKATLTTAMREVQTKLGVSEQSAHFLLPLGACINMDGTAIYLGICALFFAQLFGVELQLADYAVLLLTCTLGSIGAAGIPSGSIIFMGMVLHSVGLPIEGIGLLLGVDRVLDMVRTTINITGDCAITMIVDHTEGTLDETVYYSKD
ncbi:MAG: dicarboxylate/amino acid:cation symporter [Alphaproteobacteria bacterium]|jgi:Na+/H+-dicarboxylate symporter|nr:dicarboxylate/amino acid:cation symporter [Rickettsiales bacterium]